MKVVIILISLPSPYWPYRGGLYGYVASVLIEYSCPIAVSEISNRRVRFAITFRFSCNWRFFSVYLVGVDQFNFWGRFVSVFVLAF